MHNFFRSVSVCLGVIIAGSASAQHAGQLDSDVGLTRAEVTDLTTDSVVTFYDDGQSAYAADGSYAYTYKDGGTAQGDFAVMQDGQVCVTFDNGRSRCDRFVRSHGRIVLLTEKGDRFPLRP